MQVHVRRFGFCVVPHPLHLWEPCSAARLRLTMVLQGVAADRPFRARGRAGLRARVLLPVPARSGTQAQASSQAESRGNGHGVSATPENVSRCRHDRFPHPGPLPVGEGDLERAMRDFHGNVTAAMHDLSALTSPACRRRTGTRSHQSISVCPPSYPDPPSRADNRQTRSRGNGGATGTGLAFHHVPS